MVYSSIKSFRDDLAKYQPTHLVGVPRLFESLYGAVKSKFTNGSAFKQLIVRYLLQASESFAEARRHLQGRDQEPVDFSQKIVSLATIAALKPLYDIAEILVWGNVRNGIGGKVEAAVVGGGSLPLYLENFFDMAGIPVFVGYGLTETSPVIANRVPRHNVPGSCGLIPGLTDIKIVDPESREEVPDGHEGVLIVRGPTVFRGYHKRPDATEASFDADGYFDTGDLAKKLAKGDIVLTGRQKDLIVLSNGENVAPQSIEDAIAACPLIEQVVLCGQDERFLSALVVPDISNLGAGAMDAETKQAAEQALKSGNADDLSKAEEELLLKTKDTFLNAIRERVQNLPDYQPLFRVMAVSLVLTPFSVENNLMTQTLKIKKQEVMKRFAEKIKRMYESHEKKK
uniref:AMP-dependent synthetase/ligase domain-containing protein n=1 Tax=Rhodosorus marinus TaxID=101924 RepID=A0A7S0BL75_9RHOD|mmetsp:Transcript_20409/g.29616  ORF Transcript_20409/g.29616 Transcript_20409/m.29616 type:complete len:399 (+) Transcript_20409:170-1366(+)